MGQLGGGRGRPLVAGGHPGRGHQHGRTTCERKPRKPHWRTVHKEDQKRQAHPSPCFQPPGLHGQGFPFVLERSTLRSLHSQPTLRWREMSVLQRVVCFLIPQLPKKKKKKKQKKQKNKTQSCSPGCILGLTSNPGPTVFSLHTLCPSASSMLELLNLQSKR